MPRKDPDLFDELRVRLTALADAIGAPSSTAPKDANTATSTVDRLVVRITNLSSELRRRSSPLDDIDVVTARLLLSELGVLTSTWQALGLDARHRLESALAELHNAKAEAERILKEPES